MARKNISEEKLRQSLFEQLRAQNKWTDYCIDLVETYVVHWRLKRDLIRDIKKNGIRITVVSGNGFMTEKPNPSIADLQKETTIMLQILDKMDLKTPTLSTPDGSADGYL